MKPQVTPRIAAKGRATSGSAAVSPVKCSSSARTTSTASAAPPAISHTITPAAVMPAASIFPPGRVRRMDSSAITGRLVPSASAQSDDSPVTHKSVRMSPDAIKSARIPRETALRNSFGRADTSSPCLFGRNQPVSSNCQHRHGWTPPDILLPSSSFSPADAASLRVIFPFAHSNVHAAPRDSPVMPISRA